MKSKIESIQIDFALSRWIASINRDNNQSKLYTLTESSYCRIHKTKPIKQSGEINGTYHRFDY